MRIEVRPEDMSPSGKLRLIQQDDGDIIVCVHEDGGVSADVEFTLSGGHSPWTLAALRDLMDAMAKDQACVPWPAEDKRDGRGEWGW
jgi:hypothetical protein